MSLMPSYIRADNDNFYKNVIIKGNDFFICFDDEKPPELVIEKRDKDISNLIKRAEEILKEYGIQAIIQKDEIKENCERMFGKKFKLAFSIFLDIKKPIPFKSISHHDGIYSGKTEEAAFECFEDTQKFNFIEWRKQKFGR